MSGRGAFVVGIDLGTSNTVVAFAELAAGERIELFEVAQRAGRSDTSAMELFPSVAFAAIDGDIAEATFPGEKEGWVVGAFARKRGVEVPSRLVASAKSWLCHPSVDKVAPILPWGQEDVPKMSPFEASARYLEHVRFAWNAAHPGNRLEHQHVVLTVPASFNEVARDLTVRAARKAGLAVRLLEEPQAAFYSALRPADGSAGALADHEGDAVALVADVGGGTTDLSLIRISGPRGALTLERVAVGSHLLLGGDNMDLALAHALEPRLAGEGKKLETKVFAELVVQCKEAKERLLSKDGAADGPSEVPIAIAKRGSALMGSVMRASLTREETERLVFDGFFPRVGRSERPQRGRSALVGFGLPYERDPAITRHVAAFLGKHLPEGQPLGYVLFNGGVFRGASTRERFAEIVGSWQGEAPRIMGHADPDRAVARGAAVYGLSLLGRGPRIEGGSARAYFIGLGRGASGREDDTAVCVLAKGAEEGRRERLTGRTFKLLVGREVRFDLLSSDTAIATRAGDLVKVTDDLERLPALATKLPSSSANEVDVEMEAELTAVGTLEIACVRAHEGETRRYQLAFDLHREGEGEGGAAGPMSRGPRSLPPRSIRPPGAGVDLVERAFSKADPRDVKSLLRDLEKTVGERPTWTLDAARALADGLLAHAKMRRASPEHERVWLLLTGYCLRPGFGAPEDAERIARFVPTFAERVAFPKEARSWQQFFVAFRRVAGGLIEQTQLKMRDELDGFVAPSDAQNVKKPKGAKPEAKDDLLDLLSHLERVPSQSRAALGGWLLERTWTDRDPRLWAAIGRIGARAPAYASVHHVVSAGTAEKWIDHLLREKWSALPTAFRAAAELARRTDDRSRDVSESVREEVAKRLEKEAPDPRLARLVREVVAVGDDDRVAAFGEALPVGLRLA